jgi:hypothetical protein
MDTKAPHRKPVRSFRHEPADLRPRDGAAEDAFADDFVARNKDAINRSIRQARDPFDRGEHFTQEQVSAAVKAQRRRRRVR